jgi:hypothetical protein
MSGRYDDLNKVCENMIVTTQQKIATLTRQADAEKKQQDLINRGFPAGDQRPSRAELDLRAEIADERVRIEGYKQGLLVITPSDDLRGYQYDPVNQDMINAFAKQGRLRRLSARDLREQSATAGYDDVGRDRQGA